MSTFDYCAFYPFSDADDHQSSTDESDSPPPVPPRQSRLRSKANQIDVIKDETNVEPEFHIPNGISVNEQLPLQSGKEEGLVLDEANVRSPSMRKRDAMIMRRYNSAVSLASGKLKVDVNKNNVSCSGSRDSLVFTENGYFDSSGDNQERVDLRHTNHVANRLPCSVSNDKDGVDAQSMGSFDIVGESFESRYPWQRDISTQCDIPNYRNSLSSSGSANSDGSMFGVHGNSYLYDQAIETRPPTHPARRSSSDNVKRRQTGYRSRRPHSMTSIEGHGDINSDMYRSDTSLNAFYRGHNRTSSDPAVVNVINRKRMPLMVADDPGSVSDLESIMENPNDG